MAEFGATFKKARESLGISLDDIALETRIGTRFLQAIENEQFELLPGGIFNRGFIRSFAQRVGLDPEKAVSDYERLAANDEPLDDGSPPAMATHKKPSRLYPITVGALILLVAIFYIVTHERGKPVTENQSPEIPAEATPVSPIAPAPSEAVTPSDVPPS